MDIIDRYVSYHLTQDNINTLPILAEFMLNMNAYDKNTPTTWHIDNLKKALDDTCYRIHILLDSLNITSTAKLSATSIIGISIWSENILICERELLYIGISHKYQNQGIAYYWLQKLLNQNKHQTQFTTYLEVRASNKIAQQLYLKSGFHISGKRKAYYPIYASQQSKQIIAKEDAILMYHITT
jgi:ribosomal protein S18 acetylase RimI-like enzyme